MVLQEMNRLMGTTTREVTTMVPTMRKALVSQARVGSQRYCSFFYNSVYVMWFETFLCNIFGQLLPRPVFIFV